MHSRIQAIRHASPMGHVDVVDGSEAVGSPHCIVDRQEDFPSIFSPYGITGDAMRIKQTFDCLRARCIVFGASRDEVAILCGELALGSIDVVIWIVCEVAFVVPTTNRHNQYGFGDLALPFMIPTMPNRWDQGPLEWYCMSGGTRPLQQVQEESALACLGVWRRGGLSEKRVSQP